MAQQWEGKSKGTPLGYKIFAFLIERLGVKSAYFVLIFVSSYYLLFSFSTTRTSYYYFRKRLGYSFFKTIISIYKNYYCFGQTLIDRFAISAGYKDQFTFDFDGIDKIDELFGKGKGGILFSAHLGNFNVARFFFEKAEFKNEATVNLLVTDQESEELQKFTGATSHGATLKFIVIKDDMSHIFEMNDVLENNEVIIFAADRYVEGVQFIEKDFLGKPVKFPSGPYKLAARKKLPILFLYIMKETSSHYHFYAREPREDMEYKPSKVLMEYIRNLEIMIGKYPLQWFNFYDYWNDLKS